MSDRIPLRYAQSLLRLVPMPVEQLREELGELNLPLVLLQEQAVADASIPVEDYGRLFIHLVRRLQPQLADSPAEVESTLMFSAYRMMFQAMLHASNLEQAMQRAAVYFLRMHSRRESFRLEEVGDQVHCHFEFSDVSDEHDISPEHFNMETLNWLPGVTGHIFSMSMWHRVCSWFIGTFIDLNNVTMSQKGSPGKDYSDVFGVPVQFNASSYSFSFHRRYLEFPIVQSEASLNEMLETYPAELLRISPGIREVAPRVRQLIGCDFQRPLPSLQEVADRLYMTTPTLHRRLQDEGTSFQQLKDQCRRDTAIGYLTEGNHTTAQLAELMGFSDSSTFHRAFKKWTGLTPTEYRKRHC